MVIGHPPTRARRGGAGWGAVIARTGARAPANGSAPDLSEIAAQELRPRNPKLGAVPPQRLAAQRRRIESAGEHPDQHVFAALVQSLRTLRVVDQVEAEPRRGAAELPAAAPAAERHAAVDGADVLGVGLLGQMAGQQAERAKQPR